ncbi:MAG: rhodanese-like domain-containing protein [Phycisphaerales bacterium]|nr:rhodanese-like domain-containing protein [Phycisphaerales bacterium]
MTTPQRVLAIVGGAFLLGTGQALVTDPIVLEEANITSGTGNVKGGAPRGGQAPVEDPTEDPTPADPVDETEPTPDPDPIDDPGDEPGTSWNSTVPTASFAGSTLEQLLDAPVPEGSLTLRESRELWEMGAYFIDARYEHEYEEGHIQYAALLPAQMFDTDVDHANSVMDSIPLDATIVLYCVGGDCDASKNTAALLEQYGYSDLRIMGAGYEHWVAAGFETASGADGEVSP